MSTPSPPSQAFAPQPGPLPAAAAKNYLNADYSLKSWLLTTDHKRIAVLYLVTITLMFVLGGLAASLIRIELVTPQGDFVQAETYNRLFTGHAIIMVWFFLIPSIPTVMGNFVLPMMLGARDLAFPRLNLASWYIFVLGAAVVLGAMLSGGVDTGWTFYPPYSTSSSPSNVVLVAVGILIAGFSSILTGLVLACLGTDVHVHDSYFVIAHFHFIMVGGMVMGYMSALHYWWPKMSGRKYPEGWGRLAALTIFFGFILTFLPQFFLGYEGMARRYYQYDPKYQVLNVMSSTGAVILALGYVLPLIYLLWSLVSGPPAGPNPWGATGLEWQTPSPPPTYNFEVTPEVTTEPYDYSQEEVHRGG